MKDKLEWNNNAMELMEYISIIESIYLPCLEEYEYRINVERMEASGESIEEARKLPFGATDCMVIFKERYNSNVFPKRLSYIKYMNDKDIQFLVRFLKLDADKFWLLILFVYDYCESLFYQGQAMKPTPLEFLQQLVTIIDEAADSAVMSIKAGKLKIEIDDAPTLRFIADAVVEKLANVADNKTLKRLYKRTSEKESSMLSTSPVIAYFARMLLRFFDTQSQLVAMRKKGANHSKKELELVSRLVYFTRLSKGEKESWCDIENDTLKGYLKQYKNYKYPNNRSSIYPEFSI